MIQAFLDGFRELAFDLLNIGDDFNEIFGVKIQRFGNVIEYTEIIHNQAVCLVRSVSAVRARDGLQQSVLAHRFIQIQSLEDRRVKTGQELGRDDKDFQRMLRVSKIIQ